jgi:hypothetical protein
VPGKLVALFDVRLQQWRAIEEREQTTQHSMEQAKALLGSLKPGALLLAGPGSFGFEWVDERTELGGGWISRVKKRTTVVVLHTWKDTHPLILTETRHSLLTPCLRLETMLFCLRVSLVVLFKAEEEHGCSGFLCERSSKTGSPSHVGMSALQRSSFSPCHVW